jgi:hypothetical protein
MHTTETELLASAVAPLRRQRRSLRSAATTAIVVGTVANAFLFILGSRAGLFPDWVLIPGTWAPLGLFRVMFATVAGLGVGVAGFALLRRFLADPRRLFGRVAMTLLVLSFTQPPMVLHHAPVRMWVGLCLLHVVAALALLGALRDVEPTAGSR